MITTKYKPTVDTHTHKHTVSVFSFSIYLCTCIEKYLKLGSFIVNDIYSSLERFGIVVSSFCDYVFFESLKLMCVICTKAITWYSI